MILNSKMKKAVALYRLMKDGLYRKKQKLPKVKVFGLYVILGWARKRLGSLFGQWSNFVERRFKARSWLECMFTILQNYEVVVGFEGRLKAYRTLHKKMLEDRSKKKFFVIMLRNHLVLINRAVARWAKLPDVKAKKKHDKLKALIKHLMSKLFREKSISMSAITR